HPLLLEAVLRFQANARGELLPADGPVKVKNENVTSGMPQVPPNPATAGMGDNGGPPLFDEGDQAEQLADVLEKGFNSYLTTTAREYYPDTDRMLLMVGFGGCAFKKVYNCPIRRRPVSESIDAAKLIVSNASTDMTNATRVTHEIEMKRSTFKRMQILGVYRDIEIDSIAAPTLNDVEEKVDDIQGVDRSASMDPKDADVQLWECYCELDIKGFEHKHKGKPSGLAIPYRVTIEKTSHKVLEIRRNYRPDDLDMCLPRTFFVKYPFIPSFGFYDIGLLHILGNTTNAATAAWREMLDAGMFASFPGFLYASAAGKQKTNQFRVPPGGGVPIDTNGMPLSDAVMPLPYKAADPSQIQLVENIVQTGQRLGGTAEMNVGEGRQDAPVGTTIALIEQATKVMDAVHKRLHAAQAEEFGMLKERFQEDPEAFWRFNKKQATQWDKARFLAALNDCDLVPKADPNTSSHMMRIMKAVAVKQLQAQNPSQYDGREVDTRVLRVIGWENPESLFAKEQPGGGSDPKVQGAQIQAQQKDAQHQRQLEHDQQENQQDRQLKVMEIQAKQAADGSKSQIDQQRMQMEGGLGQAKLQSDNMKTQIQEKGLQLRAMADQRKLQADQEAQNRADQVKVATTQATNATKEKTNLEDNLTAMNITKMDITADQQANAMEIAAQDRQTAIEHAHEEKMTSAEHEHQADEAEAQRDHTADEAKAQRDHDAKQKTEDRKAKKVELKHTRKNLKNGTGVGRGPKPSTRPKR
ncbi:MAG: hypothetical protein M3N26_01295, partial [Pseudomonadota bacterium]|nr:hypothetical protein [Pseudomonadota bacterium]